MRWRKLGRIFVADAHSEWMHSHGIIPIARPIGDYRYQIYFSPRDRQVRSNVSWLDIDIREPTKVLRLSERPLLTPGALGCFDDSGAIACWLVEHGGIEHLYYQGWNRGVTVGFYVAVGLAVRRAGDPDLPFERVGAGTDPRPVHGGARLHLGPGGHRGKRPMADVVPVRPAVDCKSRISVLPSYDIRYAESSDGRRWTLGGVQSLAFRHPGEVAIARFCPLREADGSYRAWYSYRGNDWGYRIGFATSTNGIDWTRDDDRVGIECDAGSWEKPMICYPFVFDTEVGRMMLYNGGRYGAAGFGIATLEQD